MTNNIKNFGSGTVQTDLKLDAARLVDRASRELFDLAKSFTHINAIAFSSDAFTKAMNVTNAVQVFEFSADGKRTFMGIPCYIDHSLETEYRVFSGDNQFRFQLDINGEAKSLAEDTPKNGARQIVSYILGTLDEASYDKVREENGNVAYTSRVWVKGGPSKRTYRITVEAQED